MSVILLVIHAESVNACYYNLRIGYMKANLTNKKRLEKFLLAILRFNGIIELPVGNNWYYFRQLMTIYIVLLLQVEYKTTKK